MSVEPLSAAVAVAAYAAGMQSGDAAVLRGAFHERATMFGPITGQLRSLPVRAWLEAVDEGVEDAMFLSQHVELDWLEFAGPLAVATMREQLSDGDVVVTQLTLAQDEDARWLIVAKVFMPSPSGPNGADS